MGETGAEIMETLFIDGVLWVKVSQRAFEPEAGEDSRGAMAWTGDEEGIEVIFLDKEGSVGIAENESGVCSPMA